MPRNRLLALAALAAALLLGPIATLAEPWSFGVIADTQWLGADDGQNPNSVAVSVINQVNDELIRRGVKFVVAVGDLTDVGTPFNLDTRATYTQALYNAGIGFYPLRGNHESSKACAQEFVRIFPQTQTAIQNATPADAFVTTDAANLHPVAPAGGPFQVGTIVSSPSPALAGLSYAVDYGNVRLVLLDQFTRLDGTNPGTIASQNGWIAATLASRPAGTHAFVFSHKGLITEDHRDVLFGANPAADPASTDAFIGALDASGVRFFQLGHDHMHDVSKVYTTDGVSAKVTQIVSASDSSKFYTPAAVANDVTYDLPAFGVTRQVPIAQDLYQVGYYVYTVDGPEVTVEYYGVATPGYLSVSPALAGNWQLRERFGYSLNGKEFLLAQGASYEVVQDAHGDTSARILAGANGSTTVDGSGRPLVKAVNTGWSDRTALTSSDVLHLWGLTEVGATRTDVYALAVQFDATHAQPEHLGAGLFGLAAKDASGKWVNAVDLNEGGAKRFVMGAWDPSYELGTYGVDPSTRTAWAVVNHEGQFAAARFVPAGTGLGSLR